MGRKRIPVDDQEMDLEAELDEAVEMELEEEDAEEIAEALAGEEADEEAEEIEVEKPARKPRARKPRKKAEPAASLLESMSESEEEKEPEVVVSEEIEVEEEKPAPRKRALRAKPEVKMDAKPEPKTQLQTAIETFEGKAPEAGNPDTVREDLTIASVAIQKTMDTMAKQWGTVNEISTSVCSNLERVNTMLRESPAAKAPVARPAAITKVAVAVSAFSVVLSIVSLLLSQSARQAAFERAALPAPTQSKISARVETTPNIARPEALAFGQLPQKRATKSTTPKPPFVQRGKKRSR